MSTEHANIVTLARRLAAESIYNAHCQAQSHFMAFRTARADIVALIDILSPDDALPTIAYAKQQRDLMDAWSAIAERLADESGLSSSEIMSLIRK